ncbi:MAG: type I-MYXAN CRISPR-associated protein Cas6/Cmx6 [Gammaproteobacteria bacterium]|nr:type I-MYXAN CRISPR-associated protein Cas6/Cmx6 [Gammaproteobacteria bacterium]
MAMYWTDDQDKVTRYVIPDNVLDLSFSISCKCLPMEHAHALYKALSQALPWLNEEEVAGIHPIYGAESGNGWQRPDDSPTELMYISHRQKMTLRMPKHRLEEVEKLVGQILNVAGHELTVGKMKVKTLSDLPVVSARHVITETGHDEDQFLQKAADDLTAMGITIRKMLAGRERSIYTPEGILSTRSLMLADLEKEESLQLQESGLGSHRKLGCGLFLPQKGIKPVNQDG